MLRGRPAIVTSKTRGESTTEELTRGIEACLASEGVINIVKIFGSGRCRRVTRVVTPCLSGICAVSLPGKREGLKGRELYRMLGTGGMRSRPTRGVTSTLRGTGTRYKGRSIILIFNSLSCLKRIVELRQRAGIFREGGRREAL